MRTESLEFLKDLVRAHSPSGYEQPAAAVYRTYAKAFADRTVTDVNGNVSAVLNPDAPMKIMLAGHLDEIGFMIHHVSDEGLLYFSPVGGHDSVVPVGQLVWVHGKERVAGVIGRKAIHLLTADERKAKPEMHDLWIDIGASSRAEAEAVVEIGDIATYQYEFQTLMGGRASARGFDNKAGCFIVAEALRLLKEEGGLDPEVGVYTVATVQEEIGSRGARTAAFDIGAQTGLAVDMSHAIDYPGVSKTRHGRLDIGKGPSITRGANINPVVFSMLKDAAKDSGIDCQVIGAPAATPTDAGAMQINRAGMATGLIGVPLRYMHTPCEVVSLEDIENCARLMAAYCRRVRADTDFTPL
ncbi:M42 family peptidase [Fulvimarina endophytica]|uniref:M42 family peptidase n=1 Tax=Fulvimarina endophytica TaxID=2293836 RepID=A0A371X6V7_9HYPH|nr:M42 family metallopeptidase [Fulvimarina endophytica]RFC64965.1 M42 family peptidase [Fulvimarina endophytica]